MIDIDEEIIRDYVILTSEMPKGEYLKLYQSIKSRYPKVFEASECAFNSRISDEQDFTFQQIGMSLAIHSHNLASVIYMLEMKAKRCN